MNIELERIKAKLKALDAGKYQPKEPEQSDINDHLLTQEDFLAKRLKDERAFEVADPLNYFSDTLACTKCGSEYLHHTGVEVFACKEDAKTGHHITLALMGLDGSELMSMSDNSLIGNPSHRRGGILIHLICENCHGTSTRYFAQHKGCTQTGWCG